MVPEVKVPVIDAQMLARVSAAKNPRQVSQAP